jgi:outer membrane cobalamin receptor
MLALTDLPAPAQQAPATPAAPLQEIIVTGSRIAAPNEQSTSPIQVLSSQYIETTGKSSARPAGVRRIRTGSSL